MSKNEHTRNRSDLDVRFWLRLLKKSDLRRIALSADRSSGLYYCRFSDLLRRFGVIGLVG